MKNNILTLMILLGIGSFISAQTTQKKDSTIAFVPSGRPLVSIFSDFTHVTVNNKTNNAFEITRAAFGYGYNFSRDLYGKVMLEVSNSAVAGTTSPGVSAYTGQLKFAFLEYQHGIVKADLGVVGETMFDLQETVWGKRYLYKSFQDYYGFGSSIDDGAKIKFQITPQIALDFAAFNGEGYTKTQADSTFRFSGGLTVQPVKNLFARVYYDRTANQSFAAMKVAQSSFDVFVGYQSVKGALGVEYNQQSGHMNVKDHNWSGFSVYGILPVVNKLSVFARVDDLMSEKTGSATTGWNSSTTTGNGTDGQIYIIGVEFVPVKGVQISPNYRYANPSSDASNAGVHSVSTFNLNLGITVL